MASDSRRRADNALFNRLAHKNADRFDDNHRNWGFGLCFLYLRNVKGFGWNHKRVYRIYRELELNLRIKPRKRLVRQVPEPLAVPCAVTKSGRWTSCTTNWPTDAASGCST